MTRRLLSDDKFPWLMFGATVLGTVGIWLLFAVAEQSDPTQDQIRDDVREIRQILEDMQDSNG